jgi:hypothetical protein
MKKPDTPYLVDVDSGNIDIGQDTPIIKFKRVPKAVILYMHDPRSAYMPMRIITLHQEESKHISGTNYVELQGKYLIFNMNTDGFSWVSIY